MNKQIQANNCEQTSPRNSEQTEVCRSPLKSLKSADPHEEDLWVKEQSSSQLDVVQVYNSVPVVTCATHTGNSVTEIAVRVER
jgi:hypothetical protein